MNRDRFYAFAYGRATAIRRLTIKRRLRLARVKIPHEAMNDFSALLRIALERI